MEGLEKLVRELKKDKNIKIAILFGSRATGKNREDSDYDICIITGKEDDSALELSSKRHDISMFSKLPLVVRFRVFRDGKLLFCKDEKLLAKLKFWTVKHYLDEKHWRDAFTAGALA